MVSCTGSVAVFDLESKTKAPIYQSTAKTGKHLDPVWQVESGGVVLYWMGVVVPLGGCGRATGGCGHATGGCGSTIGGCGRATGGCRQYVYLHICLFVVLSRCLFDVL